MNDEEILAALEYALPHADWCHELLREPSEYPCACANDRRDVADALLPVVRRIAAEELRAAVKDDRMPVNGRIALRARAAALDPS